MRVRDDIVAALQRGESYGEIVAALGCSKSTVCFHAKRLGLAPERHAANRRYDWDIVQAYHDEGHSAIECQRHFGMAKASWRSAALRGSLTIRDHLIPLGELLTDGRKTNRSHLKRRLEGMIPKVCICGLDSWLGKPLSLHLDHINGKPDDNRLENLRYLCPNCHSQTPTWGRKIRQPIGE